ncbi:putative long-chain-alcohol O-fatty-acyltransferase 1 [Choanephora cucurbitarum]|uniref:Putative long-chain-alcohol O-fatty-acyltransferase 1 n=1 Tax=Choanephora cucurbitarum TaxID=101091 RepID=A0A1C7NIN9_9FUNG|nr:putative long-chain-alcohol O-fatty-acyltransferase 1 [Choanephora cucurbitarum]
MHYNVFAICLLPSILFQILTIRFKRVSNWVLVVIGLWQIAIPIALDAQATTVEMSICAVIAILLTSGMMSFVLKRNEYDSVATLYDIFLGWKQMVITHRPIKPTPTNQIRRDALLYLAKAIAQLALCVPFFAVSDGFVRMCPEPPESVETTMTYLIRLVSHLVQGKTLFYYLWIGITLSMHIAIVPPLGFLLAAILLNVVSYLPIQVSWQQKLYHEVSALNTQPPLFDRLWLTRSAYDLWSRRWHQFFRYGFRHVAYDPVKRLFGSHSWAGRLAGTMAVFLCSGIMHDYIVLVMLGYSSIRPDVFGQQTIFFLLQGIATVVSMQSPTLPTWLARVVTWIWIIYTAPIFGEPFVRLGLHQYARVPGFPYFLDNSMTLFCPF